MKRRDLGQWGLDLAPGAFACALAALGSLYAFNQHLDTLIRASSQEIGDALRAINIFQGNDARGLMTCYYGAYGSRYEQAHQLSPHVLAESWRNFIEGMRENYEDRSPVLDEKRVRLEIVPHEQDLQWLVEQLSLTEVGVASVYVRADEPAEVGWDWPLHVGFLSDPASRELRESLGKLAAREGYWLGRLVELVDIGQRRDFKPATRACDLLLIPSDLSAGLANLLKMQEHTQADCVLVLDPAREASPRDLQMAITLRNAAHSAGVGIGYVPQEACDDWFRELMRELSHNEPLDIALYRACRRAKTSTPLLIASRQLATFSRVTKTIAALTERLISIGEPGAVIEVGGEEAHGFNIPAGTYTPLQLGRALQISAQDSILTADGRVIAGTPRFRFQSEGGAATATVILKTRMRPLLTAAPVPEPQQRWIQTQVYDLSTPGEGRRLWHALRANAPHALVVRVGRSGQEWQTADVAFPDQQLPPNEGEHELTVVFSEPQLLPDGPQTATIVLPREGDSTECRFFFQAGTNVTRIEGRIIILHRNRVLQTALLRASVMPDPYEAVEGKIRLEVEVVTRPGMGDLDLHHGFDAAIVFNHDGERRPGTTKLSDHFAAFSTHSDTKSWIRRIDDALTEIANDRQRYEGGLKTPATVALLRTFAEYGNGLYESIFFDQLHDKAFVRAQKIQIITAEPEARVPIEFIYDKEVPERNAGLCPNADEALRQGQCQETCPTGRAQRTVVCPLGFWGVRKVIEHHLHVPEYTKESVNGDFRLQAEPVSTRDSLNVLNCGLIAASVRADNLKEKSGGVDAVVETVGRVTANPPKRVRSWEDWAREVTNSSPSMLILLTHTALSDNNLQELEIEDGLSEETRLRVSQLRPEYVREPETNPPPLVMLMGCETGSPDIGFLGFVPKFRRLGAAIIVSTGATVLGYQAVPVTREFVNTLADISKAGDGSFGDVMLAVKQKMLAEGLPMALCLMAFGDADWKLVFRP